MTDDKPLKQESVPEPSEGAREFLLQEYQNLFTQHQAAEEVGEKRLNFYVTFVTVAGSILIAAQQFIVDEMYLWLLVGGIVIIVCIGLITFRKMLQRRVEIITFRRRMDRIRTWFLRYYPSIALGLPYDVSRSISMDWGKNRLGTLASSVALLNTTLVVFVVVSIVVSTLSLAALWWALLIAIGSGGVTWKLHLIWKNQAIEIGEMLDRSYMAALEELSSRVLIIGNSEDV